MWLSLILTLSSQVFIPLWLQSKESAWNAGGKKDQVWSLDKEDPLEDEMATHSSILAWKIPWMEEPRMLHPWGCKELDMTERLSLLLTDPCHMTQKIWYNFIKNTTHSPTNSVYTDTSLLSMLVEDTRNDKMICCLSSFILAKNDKF